MVVLLTAKIDQDPVGEVQVFDADPRGHLSPVGTAITLPGPFVGTDPTGSSLAAESASGTIVTRAVSGGWWTQAGSTDVRAAPPGREQSPGSGLPPNLAWVLQGSHRWSPDLDRVAWVQVTDGTARASSTVGWVRLHTGRWTTLAVPGSAAACVGWRGTDLVLQSNPVIGRTDIESVGADGVVRMVGSYTYGPDTGDQAGLNEVSVAVDRLPRPAG
jgi:hypothetical protein